MSKVTKHIKNFFFFLSGIITTLAVLSLLSNSQSDVLASPMYLPQPIASEKVLITSAGQSIDTYIVKDVANDLLLHNTFIPNVDEDDLTEINSVVIVIGHSDTGELLHEVDHQGETERVKRVIEKAQSSSQPIIAVFIGGKERRSRKTDQLLDLVCSSSSFIIATESGDHDLFISTIADTNSIPLVKIQDIQSFRAPFSSLFR